METTPEARILADVAAMHGRAIRQLRELVERAEAHAREEMRILADALPPEAEPRWRLQDAQASLERARKSLAAAEEAVDRG